MPGPGHCLCDEHKGRYKPRNIIPAYYVGPLNLRTALFCGRCAKDGQRQRGGVVFGEDSLNDGCVQFTHQAAYWLTREELQARARVA